MVKLKWFINPKQRNIRMKDGYMVEIQQEPGLIKRKT